MDYANPVVIAGNILIYSAIYVCAYFVLEPRMNILKILLISFVPAAVGYWFPPIIFKEYALLRSFTGFGLMFLPILLLYKDKLYKKLLFVLLAILCIGITEVTSVLVYKEITPEIYIELYLTYLSILYSLLFAMTLAFWYFNKKRRADVTVKDRVVIMILPFSQFAALMGWLRYITVFKLQGNFLSNGFFSAAVTLLMIVTADILLLKTFKRSTTAAKLEAENAALAYQISAQKKYYTVLDAQFSAIREIRHDISNHMYTISALIDEGKTAEASQYANEYLSNAGKAQMKRICAEPSVNAYLNYKLSELGKKGISADLSVDFPRYRGMPAVDIVTVLGNLLDNADEACGGLSDAVVRLGICSENGFVKILMENPCGDDVRHSERFPGMQRGIGYKIISDIAAKYSGAFTHGISDGIYHCVVSLKCPDAEDA